MKKIVLVGIVVLLAGYFAVGYLFIHPSEEKLVSEGENVTISQELGRKMADMEKKAHEQKEQTYLSVKKGSLSQQELEEKIQKSIQYLRAHLKELENDETYLQLVYHSGVLLSFSYVPDSTKTPLQRKIEEQAVSAGATKVHNYIVDHMEERTPEDGLQKELAKVLEALSKAEIREFTGLVYQDAGGK